MHSDVHFCFSTLSFSQYQPLGHSFRCLGACCSLLFTHFCLSCHYLPLCHSESFTLPSCRRLLSHFLVPSLASHSFTSASHCLCRPLTRSLQLLVAKVDFLSSQEVLQENHKSSYGPAKQVNKLLAALHKNCGTPLGKTYATTQKLWLQKAR